MMKIFMALLFSSFISMLMVVLVSSCGFFYFWFFDMILLGNNRTMVEMFLVCFQFCGLFVGLPLYLYLSVQLILRLRRDK